MLEAKGISVAIKGVDIVQNCDLTLALGEIVGLIGPNGAGKSTLLKAMLGLRPKSAGLVQLGGRDFAAIPDRERARLVAFLPQERRVEWRLSARDVVMLGRYPHHSGFGGPSPADMAAVDRAIEQVEGRSLLDRPVAVLSGGERTRILLARALAVEAPILLVDEPISALDPYHQLHVMEILRDLAGGGVGVLVVIHDLSLAARFMDRLVLMHRSAIVAQGTPDSVLSPEILRQVYGVEALKGEHGGARWVLPWSRVT